MTPPQYKNLKTRFITKQLLYGVLAIGLVFLSVWLLNLLFKVAIGDISCYLATRKELLYQALFLNELLGNIVPADVFILPLEKKEPLHYAIQAFFLATISYFVATLLYFVARSMKETRLLKKFILRRHRKLLRQINRFGGIFLMLSAIAPLPFSLTCMLVGATGYPIRYFLLCSCMRYIRFVVPAVFYWYATPTMPC